MENFVKISFRNWNTIRSGGPGVILVRVRVRENLSNNRGVIIKERKE